MKRMVVSGIAGVIAVLLTLTTHAKESGYGIGVTAGTLGLGAEFIKSLADDMDIRVGINGYRYATKSKQLEQGRSSGPLDYTDYDVTYDWQSTAILIDIYMAPHGTFHEVIGYVFSNNRMMLNTPVGGAYDINGVIGHLKAGQYLKGALLFESGPYLGFGWGNATVRKGFGMNFEFGFVYFGVPKATLKTNVPGVTSDDLRSEELGVSDTKHLSICRWYPNIALGLSYGF